MAAWPHYLRFHEIHGLIVYIHPFRFAKVASSMTHGVEASRFFSDRRHDEWESMAKKEVDAIEMNRENDWLKVLTSYLDGSRLQQPEDAEQYATVFGDFRQALSLSRTSTWSATRPTQSEAVERAESSSLGLGSTQWSINHKFWSELEASKTTWW